MLCVGAFLQEMDSIRREELFVEILTQNVKISFRKLKLGKQMGLPNGQ